MSEDEILREQLIARAVIVGLRLLVLVVTCVIVWVLSRDGLTQEDMYAIDAIHNLTK